MNENFSFCPIPSNTLLKYDSLILVTWRWGVGVICKYHNIFWPCGPLHNGGGVYYKHFTTHRRLYFDTTPCCPLVRFYHDNHITTHDDVIKWENFPCYWPFLRGIHRSPVNSPHKGQWHGALMFSLIGTWTNVRVNNREAGDLRLPHTCPWVPGF